MLQTVTLLALGLALLTLGAEGLVRGASRLAGFLGLSPLFIGLTLVAYGTSSPELVVSTVAVFRNLPNVAVGNVVGSNIFNTGVVLGVSALITPLHCHRNLIRRDAPAVVAVTLVLAAMSVGGLLDRGEALILLAGLVVYTGWAYRSAMRQGTAMGSDSAESGGADPAAEIEEGPAWLSGLLVLAGVVLLAVGANWTVNAAIKMASAIGISDTVVGLTVVAAGTSLPELATSIVAATRREPDIAIGNVLGSNVFNVMGILGITGLVHPLTIAPHVRHLDLPVAIAFAVISVPIMLSARRISRLEGLTLCLGYATYLTFLTLKALGAI